MARDNAAIHYIRAIKKLEKKIERDASEFYSSLAITMAEEYKWDYQQICELFVKVGVTWAEIVDQEVDAVAVCYQKTGIDVMDKITCSEVEDEQ